MTLPSKHSGCPVASLTSITLTPASLSFRDVPPVDKISQPISDNEIARGSIPDFSQTLSRARGAAISRRRSIGLEVFVRGSFNRPERKLLGRFLASQLWSHMLIVMIP